MMTNVRRFVRGNVKVAALVVAVGCTGPSLHEDHNMTEVGSDPQPAPWGNVAQAHDTECKDAGVPWPANPAMVSLRLPKVPEVRVTKLSGQKYDGPFSVTETDTEIVVTLYVEQGVETRVSVTPVDAEKRPLAESIDLFITAQSKLATTELVPGQSVGEVTFPAKDQVELKLGETFLQGPATTEFVDGTMRDVFQGVYTADEDCIREVSWTGCETVYSFLDGPPVPRTEPFILSLKAGQKLGIYPILDHSVEAVKVGLYDPSCLPTPPAEE